LTALIPYDQARIMLAEAKAVDDVKDILDKAVAMKKYAERAADRSLEIDAAEIRFHAERRLGQMISAQKATVGLNQGTRGQLHGRDISGAAERVAPEQPSPTLADVGISHKLSAHAQKMAAVPVDQFEARLASWREEVSAGGARVTVDLLKIGEEERQRQARRDLAAALGDTSHQLTGQRRFACIYADSAVRRKAGIGNRAYENHYPTMTWDEIMALPVKDLLQPNAWGFIWIPRAHMLALHPVKYTIQTEDGALHDVSIKTPLIWAIARAWGFDDYSTCFVWTKTDEEHADEIGTGLVVRDQDEILCLFKKGAGLPKPASDEKFGSNHRERSRPLGHSRKPQFYRDMIAKMVGTDAEGRPLPVLELFARNDPDNPLPESWEAWGNEAPTAAENNLSEAAE
jgi:N6-adenosine-specific RNA methylase IME4